MPRCIRIQKKKRGICIGDMRDEILLQNRSIAPPVLASDPDYTETFEDDDTTFSLIETVSGKTYFDGVDTETTITHHIYIRYDETVTAETWIEFNSKRIDILDVEDLDERQEYMKLVCHETGLVEKAAAEA